MHSIKEINTQCQQVHTDAHQSLLVLHRYCVEINKAVDAGYLCTHCYHIAPLSQHSHLNKPTVVLLCTYANVLIKCAINNSVFSS